jgi:hypothetical protein
MLVSVDGFHLSAEAEEKKGDKTPKKMAGKAKRKSDKISVANLLVDVLQVTLFQRFNSQSQGKPALFSGFLKQGTPPSLTAVLHDTIPATARASRVVPVLRGSRARLSRKAGFTMVYPEKSG